MNIIFKNFFSRLMNCFCYSFVTFRLLLSFFMKSAKGPRCKALYKHCINIIIYLFINFKCYHYHYHHKCYHYYNYYCCCCCYCYPKIKCIHYTAQLTLSELWLIIECGEYKKQYINKVSRHQVNYFKNRIQATTEQTIIHFFKLQEVKFILYHFLFNVYLKPIPSGTK